MLMISSSCLEVNHSLCSKNFQTFPVGSIFSTYIPEFIDPSGMTDICSVLILGLMGERLSRSLMIPSSLDVEKWIFICLVDV